MKPLIYKIRTRTETWHLVNKKVRGDVWGHIEDHIGTDTWIYIWGNANGYVVDQIKEELDETT